MLALNGMKTGKAAEPSGIKLEVIAANGEVETHVMVELCHGVLCEFGMPSE